MTHGTDDSQAPDTPPGPAQTLLLASLERALTADEMRQLRSAAEEDPALADDCATFGLLRALRLENRIARHEARAWDAFQRLAQRYAANAAQPTPAAGRWRQWLAQCMPSPRRAMPAFAALASLLILVQAGGLVWLAQRPVDGTAMRGVGAVVCPAVLIRLRPQATMGELTRVLSQAQARVVDGPDGAGNYRLAGPPSFVQDAGTLLGDLAQKVTPALDCAR